MSNYRRPKRTGASVFFTVNLADRSSDLLVRRIDTLREVVAITRSERPFEIDAWVVLPDHMHCVWTLPEADADFSTRMGAIKARFSMNVRRAGFTPPRVLAHRWYRKQRVGLAMGPVRINAHPTGVIS